MAHLALMADSFASHGVIALHGVPIQNAGVDGTYPDFYVHWPPLCAAFLSLVVRVFGDSEPVIFASGAIMALAFACSWFWLTDELFGRVRALSSTFALLTLGVFVDRSHVWTVAFCYAFVLISLRIVLAEWDKPRHTKRSMLMAGSALALAVLSSWEALLLPPGLLLSALFLKDRKLARYSFFLWAIAALTFIAYLAICFAYVPELRRELIATIRYRAGLGFASPATLNTLADAVTYASQPTVRELIEVLVIRLFTSIGIIAITSSVLYLRRFWGARTGSLQRKQFVVFTSLAFVVVAWFAVFRNHVYVHDYEFLIAAPVAAIGTGELLHWLWVESQGTWRQILYLILPAILIFHLALQCLEAFGSTNLPEDAQLSKGVRDYALEMGSATSPSSVVASPYLGMYVAYYAKRHVIRGVQDDRAVQLLFTHMQDYPNDPVFLDVPLDKLADFPCSVASFEKTQLKYGVLLNIRLNHGMSLTGPGCSSAPRQRYAFP